MKLNPILVQLAYKYIKRANESDDQDTSSGSPDHSANSSKMPPNLTNALPGALETCASCKYMLQTGTCKKYNYPVMPTQVCNSWEAKDLQLPEPMDPSAGQGAGSPMGDPGTAAASPALSPAPTPMDESTTSLVKQGADPAIESLKQLKAHSDRGDYPAKHAIARKLMTEAPDDFTQDSDQGHTVGITHKSGFRFHLPRTAVPTRTKAAYEKTPSQSGGIVSNIGGQQLSLGPTQPPPQGNNQLANMPNAPSKSEYYRKTKGLNEGEEHWLPNQQMPKNANFPDNSVMGTGSIMPPQGQQVQPVPKAQLSLTAPKPLVDPHGPQTQLANAPATPQIAPQPPVGQQVPKMACLFEEGLPANRYEKWSRVASILNKKASQTLVDFDQPQTNPGPLEQIEQIYECHKTKQADAHFACSVSKGHKSSASCELSVTRDSTKRAELRAPLDSSLTGSSRVAQDALPLLVVGDMHVKRAFDFGDKYDRSNASYQAWQKPPFQMADQYNRDYSAPVGLGPTGGNAKITFPKLGGLMQKGAELPGASLNDANHALFGPPPTGPAPGGVPQGFGDFVNDGFTRMGGGTPAIDQPAPEPATRKVNATPEQYNASFPKPAGPAVQGLMPEQWGKNGRLTPEEVAAAKAHNAKVREQAANPGYRPSNAPSAKPGVAQVPAGPTDKPVPPTVAPPAPVPGTPVDKNLPPAGTPPVAPTPAADPTPVAPSPVGKPGDLSDEDAKKIGDIRKQKGQAAAGGPAAAPPASPYNFPDAPDKNDPAAMATAKRNYGNMTSDEMFHNAATVNGPNGPQHNPQIEEQLRNEVKSMPQAEFQKKYPQLAGQHAAMLYGQQADWGDQSKGETQLNQNAAAAQTEDPAELKRRQESYPGAQQPAAPTGPAPKGILSYNAATRARMRGDGMSGADQQQARGQVEANRGRSADMGKSVDAVVGPDPTANVDWKALANSNPAEYRAQKQKQQVYQQTRSAELRKQQAAGPQTPGSNMNQLDPEFKPGFTPHTAQGIAEQTRQQGAAAQQAATQAKMQIAQGLIAKGIKPQQAMMQAHQQYTQQQAQPQQPEQPTAPVINRQPGLGIPVEPAATPAPGAKPDAPAAGAPPATPAAKPDDDQAKAGDKAKPAGGNANLASTKQIDPHPGLGAPQPGEHLNV